jgi:hypothetical protein
LAATGRAQAPAPLNRPVPLAVAGAVNAPSPGTAAVAVAAAERAQALGVPATAVELYRGALEQSGVDRAALTLGLVTALLDDGRAAEAEAALNGFIGLRGTAWQLRAGLAAVTLRKMDAAKAAVAAVKPGEAKPDHGESDHEGWARFSP